MTPVPDNSKIPGHAPEKKRQGKHDADNELFRLIPNLGLSGNLLDIFRGFGFIFGKDRFESGLFNGRGHIIDTGRHGVIFNKYPLGCKIHRSLRDARNFADQCPFDVHGTIGTGHSGDRKLDRCGAGKGCCIGHGIFSLSLPESSPSISGAGRIIDVL